MTRTMAIAGVLILAAGCNQQSATIVDNLPESATAVAFNSEGAPIVEFSVPDMMCPEGCGEATREILAGQEGVKDVKIDFPAKIAVVAVDEEKFNSDKALAELIDHGFDKSTLKASSAQ